MGWMRRGDGSPWRSGPPCLAGVGVEGSPALGLRPHGHPERPVPRQTQSSPIPMATTASLQLRVSGPSAALLPGWAQGLWEPT